MIKSVFTSFINFFTFKNVAKIILIFVIGFLGRIFMVDCFNVDVFYNYLSFCSIFYYINMSIISIWLSEFFTNIPKLDTNDIIKGVNNIVKGMKNIIMSICDKCYITLNGSSLDTKSYKEIKSVTRRYTYVMYANKDNAGSSKNFESNLDKSNGSKGKSKQIESGIESVNPNLAKLDKITKDLDYKDSIINDKKINNTDKLRRLQMLDHSPETSDSSGDAKRV